MGKRYFMRLGFGRISYIAQPTMRHSEQRCAHFCSVWWYEYAQKMTARRIVPSCEGSRIDWARSQLEFHSQWKCDLGPVPISDKMSFHKISWRLEAARLVVQIITSLWNLTGTSAARCLSYFRAIGLFQPEQVSTSDPRAFWKYLKTLGPRDSEDPPLKVYDNNNEVTFDIVFVLQKWANEYCQLYSPYKDGNF